MKTKSRIGDYNSKYTKSAQKVTSTSNKTCDKGIDCALRVFKKTGCAANCICIEIYGLRLSVVEKYTNWGLLQEDF